MSVAYDPAAALSLIDAIRADLDRLRGLVQPAAPTLDPRDPRNKFGDFKLTPRGVEICYRLFDQGKTRYAVSQAMDISFQAASYRQHAWEEAGGVKRARKPLDD